MESQSPVWFITGASSGFGAALAINALNAGHRAVATARNPSKASSSYPDIERLGGKWVQLDVTASDLEDKVTAALDIYGKFDIVVNNAGYSLIGSVEDIDAEEARAQIETNVIGPHRVIRTVLPSLRKLKSSTIVNVSSMVGFEGLPTCGFYSASKFALEGMTEALAAEVQPFNIRVVLVEPGAFRSNFLGAAVKAKSGLSEAYKGTVTDDTMKYFEWADRKQPGDIEKGARKMFEVITATGDGVGLEKYLRAPLGSDCIGDLEKKIQSLQENLEAYREIAKTTDHDQQFTPPGQ